MPGSKKYAAVGGVAFDSDTVALLSDGMSLDAVRLGPSGAIVTAPFTVATRPYAMRSHNTDQLFARRGTEAVAGWNTEVDIRLARIAP